MLCKFPLFLTVKLKLGHIFFQSFFDGFFFFFHNSQKGSELGFVNVALVDFLNFATSEKK